MNWTEVAKPATLVQILVITKLNRLQSRCKSPGFQDQSFAPMVRACANISP